MVGPHMVIRLNKRAAARSRREGICLRFEQASAVHGGKSPFTEFPVHPPSDADLGNELDATWWSCQSLIASRRQQSCWRGTLLLIPAAGVPGVASSPVRRRPRSHLQPELTTTFLHKRSAGIKDERHA
jgi:hypothetical protein